MSEKQNLLLVGGGHAHVEVLRRLALRPIPNVDVALFDPSPSVWYSGMIPGVIAGHYEAQAAKVNLWALCQKARVRFIEAAIDNVDAAMQRVYTSQGERHFYDVLSLDIGSVSRTLPLSPGSYVVPAKPVDSLLNAITEREAIRSSNFTVQVVGGGAAAVEIALALAHHWAAAPEKKIALLSATPLLSSFPNRARSIALQHCERMNVGVREAQTVTKIEPSRIVLDSGETIDAHLTVLATGYAPAPLLEKIDIQKTEDGSISVNSGLQSRSHKNIFAAGDCASNPKLSVPKAGVYAVRQGPFLYENLVRTLRGGQLQSYKHDPQSLALISLGGKNAIATRGRFAIGGRWAWTWKDKIDRRWLTQYS
jgi:selenide, water dikinase